MLHVARKSLVLIAALFAVATLSAACESDVQRQMRLEREALEKDGELEKLEGQLDTTNPDTYSRENAGTYNIGRARR